MFVSKVVTVPAAPTAQTVVFKGLGGSGHYTVVIANTGAHPASLGDSTVVNPGAFTFAAGASLVLDMPADDTLFASSTLGTTIEVLATNGIDVG